MTGVAGNVGVGLMMSGTNTVVTSSFVAFSVGEASMMLLMLLLLELELELVLVLIRRGVVNVAGVARQIMGTV